ncbi:PIR Superfamily Protein [Plasmodium ovale curtisi]|uniref:PIR Superfamily Protein n=1 Tax=Plasmodium ovale curtisi TaxID=864141 RepID=A0A1A8XFW7_PLAOA|nr:PIR Superfamily Protein [Plasmodium ovale curtisi]SBT02819.1 PIR Superfamily Protein [Plasmodium ovale curtisi]
MEEGEQILENLSKYKLYNKFNEKHDDASEYSSYCRTMLYLKRSYSDILEVCYLFAKNLINLHKIINEEEDSSERCRYFNFWITDYVRKILETKWKDKSNIHRVLTGFLTVEKNIPAESKNNNCLYDYNSNIDLDLWKERKYLHDYIENYNDINVIINSDGQLCKIYFKYFDYIKELHDKYKQECCNGNFGKCHNDINLDYFCTSEKFNNKLVCDETKEIKVASTGYERPQHRDGAQEDDSFHSINSFSTEHRNDINGYAMTNNTGYYTKLGIGLPFLGIVSSLFYLYKFTTFGNMIRSKVLKTKIKVNLDEDTQNLMGHELNNEDESFYRDDYKITYHSS